MGLSTRPQLAIAADVLTGVRLPAGIGVILLITSNSWTLVALLVSIMWIADLLDGRLARLSGLASRLGRFDLTFDTIFAACVVVGLMAGDLLPLWLGSGSLIVFGGFFLAGNVAASMLLQLTGYLPLLSELWQLRPAAWWAPFAVALLAGVIDWRRLVFTNIPAFIRGMTGRFESR